MNFNMKKIISTILIISCISIFAACENVNNRINVDNATNEIDSDANQNVQKMNESFYMIVLDVFEIRDEGIVVTGVVQNSDLYSGIDVDILTKQGRISTQIYEMEVYEKGIVDYVEKDSNVGIYFKDLEKEDLHPGDLIVLPECGKNCSSVDCIVALVELDDQSLHNFTENEKVYLFYFSGERFEATANIIEYIEDDMFFMHFDATDNMICCDEERIAIYDANNQLIAAARIIF